MATVLDIGLFKFLTPLFSFLFILVIIYAVLDKFKIMGDNKALKWIASFSIAFIFIFSSVVKLINFITPWFVFLAIIFLFVISLFIFTGVKEEEMVKTVQNPNVYWPVLILIIVFLIVAVSQVFREEIQPSEEPEVGKAISGIQAFVHPRLLGAVFLLIIAAIAIKAISEKVVT